MITSRSQGYSSGMLTGANDPNINFGGQCEDGLKMIIIIGEVSLNDDGSLPTDGSSGSSANSPQSGGIQPPAGKSGTIHTPNVTYVARDVCDIACMYTNTSKVNVLIEVVLYIPLYNRLE